MLGRNIKNYLEENGIKQGFLSDKTGIPRTRLNDILNERSPAKAIEYFLLCNALNVPLDTFLPQDKTA